MRKKYLVTLSAAERTQLRTLVHKGHASTRTITRAHVLLLADAGRTDAAIAARVQVGTTTVERLRRRYMQDGLTATLQERPRPGAQPKRTGKQEALLVALTCSEPPDEHPHWTMQLLAERLVAIGVVDTVSDETVRRVLKKRPQTMAETALVHRDSWGRFRLADGGRPRSVRRTVRPAAPRRLLR